MTGGDSRKGPGRSVAVTEVVVGNRVGPQEQNH